MSVAEDEHLVERLQHTHLRGNVDARGVVNRGGCLRLHIDCNRIAIQGEDDVLRVAGRRVGEQAGTEGSIDVGRTNNRATSLRGASNYLKLAFGMEASDRQFKNRTKQIKRIYEKTPEDKYLTGHSLGASQITYALSKSPSILENTKHAVAFNAGYTPFFHGSIAKDPKVVKAVNKKLTHYHARGDPISSSLTDKAVGRLKIVEPKLNDPHTINNFTANDEE